MEIVKDLGSRECVSRSGNKRNRRYGLFRCETCGEDVELPVDNGKKAKTCAGCRYKNVKPLKHGMCKTRQYSIWRNLKARCSNPDREDYKYYGGRGVKYVSTWETFEGFWADMKDGYSDNLTIDRVNNECDYCKENCKWIPLAVNAAKDKYKRVLQFNLVGNKERKVCSTVVAEFSSVLEASEKTGFNKTCIARCCRGERASSNGFGWRYAS